MIVVEEAPVPALADGDVLVEVHAAAITPSELGWWPTWAHRDGSPRAPVVPGHEVAGIVVARRGNTDLAVGSRVFGLTDFFGDGAAAEYVAVRAADLAEWPVGVDAVSIAAIPLSALTAWQALFDQGHLLRGRRALVHGATGGVGSFVVQLAHLEGGIILVAPRARRATCFDRAELARHRGRRSARPILHRQSRSRSPR